MENNFISIPAITDDDLIRKTVAELSDRPNKVSAFGEKGLAAHELKKRFDEFPEVVKEKINDIVKILNSEDATKYIRLPSADLGASLYDFFGFFKGADGEPIDDKICVSYDSPFDIGGAKLGTLEDILNQITADYASLSDQNDTNSKKVNDLNDYGMAMDKLDGLVVEVKKLKDTFENIERAISDLEDRLDNIDNNVGA